ncbi:universal stress protein [Paraburkholderia panacisoli]|uniref:Universal stress protein n=1 Tax=Paraburkholderia panacisoli TaxID=2603818 RepID=A0A5B0HE16_9BURK|nr:universal stress protein [Paraburkholderia panacisoli]KAA1013549.1 universal stress protein [Paraburkholderia panacisoli]
MFKHLLVPTDGSALSEVAVQMAVTFAAENHACVTGLHVMPEFHVLAYGIEMLADTEEKFVQVHRERAEAFLATVTKAASQASVRCETVATTRAHPYEAIISTATERNCDLIVMASHGRSGVRGLLIGSETQKVLTHSAIPVLVVRQSTQTGVVGEAGAGTQSTTSKSSPPHGFIIGRIQRAVTPARST